MLVKKTIDVSIKIKFNLKKLIKILIGISGKHRWPFRSSQLLILAYHRVLPKSDSRFYFEQPMMVVTPETFDNNIKWASEHFKFIKLDDWLNACENNTPPKGKYCAITFDDGWIDNMEYALPILKKHNAPATIFCVSDMLNNKINYWPGRVTKLIYEVSKNSDIQNYINHPFFEWLKKATANTNINWTQPTTGDFSNIVESLKTYKDLEIISLVDNTKKQLSLDYSEQRQVLNIDELKSMYATNLISYGSHTINHIRMTQETPEDVLIKEIKNSKDELKEKLNSDINTFCYPNGYHPPNSVKLAKQHYLGACTLAKGWNNPTTDFSTLRRISFHEAVAKDKFQFKALLSGWL